MGKVLKFAARNLMRYRRRTLLTSLLITLGIVAVLLFVSIAGSFKGVVTGEITDSVLGDLEIHHRGYVASIDNLPLNLDIPPQALNKVEAVLKDIDEVVAYSPRVKFGAMFSNFEETTSIRLNGIDPVAEARTCPGLPKRLLTAASEGPLLNPGEILIPELLAKGMKVKTGDTVVLIATNLDGSVNGKTFTVRGVLEPVTGPGGRDGYIHIEDARELLRMAQPEVMEIAVRIKHFDRVEQVRSTLLARLADIKTGQGQPLLEVHTWDQLSPFANVARMIDMMTVFIRVMLIAIVLISVTNVMLMAVYERVREIGTIAAIGTQPRRILGLFVGEGVLLGLLGAGIGTILSLALIALLNVFKISVAFGRSVYTLTPTIAASDVIVVALMVIAIAVLASLQPAWKASRMDPITALRHV